MDSNEMKDLQLPKMSRFSRMTKNFNISIFKKSIRKASFLNLHFFLIYSAYLDQFQGPKKLKIKNLNANNYANRSIKDLIYLTYFNKYSFLIFIFCSTIHVKKNIPNKCKTFHNNIYIT